ncbi:hypothetical protein DFP83_1332 [Idiomarina fontislapidosi]|nr:hypothetical protein DFP83_1332 [Idiomarina fontislapidosi]
MCVIMIKVTEEKLLAFELFLHHQKFGKKRAFEVFTAPQERFEQKAVFDLLEVADCVAIIKNTL